MKDPRDAHYSQNYYLHSCEGADTWRASRGAELSRLHRRVLELAQVLPGQKILDFGCGRGELAIQAALRGCQVTAMDSSPAAITICREALRRPGLRPNAVADRIRLVQASFRKAKLPFGRFDVVLMADVVEHLWEDELREAFRLTRRWLKPGGRLVIHTMPTREFIRVGQYAKWALYRMRGRPALLTSFAEEAKNTHVNIQTQKQLLDLLTDFRWKDVWYDFSISGGIPKELLRRSHLHRWFAHNLWAVAVR